MSCCAAKCSQSARRLWMRSGTSAKRVWSSEKSRWRTVFAQRFRMASINSPCTSSSGVADGSNSRTVRSPACGVKAASSGKSGALHGLTDRRDVSWFVAGRLDPLRSHVLTEWFAAVCRSCSVRELSMGTMSVCAARAAQNMEMAAKTARGTMMRPTMLQIMRASHGAPAESAAALGAEPSTRSAESAEASGSGERPGRKSGSQPYSP